MLSRGGPCCEQNNGPRHLYVELPRRCIFGNHCSGQFTTNFYRHKMSKICNDNLSLVMFLTAVGGTQVLLLLFNFARMSLITIFRSTWQNFPLSWEWITASSAICAVVASNFRYLLGIFASNKRRGWPSMSSATLKCLSTWIAHICKWHIYNCFFDFVSEIRAYICPNAKVCNSPSLIKELNIVWKGHGCICSSSLWGVQTISYLCLFHTPRSFTRHVRSMALRAVSGVKACSTLGIFLYTSRAFGHRSSW